MICAIFFVLLLTIAAMGRSQHAYYERLAQEDYYSQGGEPPGYYLGDGARQLGYRGKVQPGDLRSLFEGFCPRTRKALVQNAGVFDKDNKRSRRPGFDFTFSAPKSLSVLWSQADPRTRRDIEKAIDAALRKTIAYLEEEAVFCRAGRGGNQRLAAKLVVLAYLHTTSRSLDPLLHIHALVTNIGVTADGKTRSLLNKPLFTHQRAAGAYFRLALAREIEERLGILVRRPRNSKGELESWWEIRGVPRKLIRLFSKRRQEIETKLGTPKLASAAAARKATLITRQAKDIVPARVELFRRWRQEAKQAGHGRAWIRRVVGHHPTRRPAKDYRKAFVAAVRSITQSESHFNKLQLAQAVFEHSQGRGLDGEYVRNRLEHDLRNHPQLISLGVRNDEERWTTKEHFRVEAGFLRSVRRLRSASFRPISNAAIKKYKAKSRAAGFSLTAEQNQAVHHLTQSPGRVKAVTGLAGTGKTTVMRAVRELYEGRGYRVVGCAVAGVAAENLYKGSGIASDTVAKRLLELYPKPWRLAKHHVRQLIRAARHKKTYKPDRLRIGPKTVLAIDEASMVSTGEFALLARAVERGGGILVCVGDHRQLPAIEQGGAFGSLISRIPDTPHLEEISRQQNLVERERVKKLSRGEAEEVLKAYAAEGALSVEADRIEARRKVISDWARRGGLRFPDKHVVFAPMNCDIDQLNDLAQKERIRSGHVDPSQAVTLGEETLHPGDRVLFTKKSRALSLENGNLGTVVAIQRTAAATKIIVRLDGEKKPRVIPIRSGLREGYRAMKRGYAFTVHRMQGATVQHSYCLLGGGMSDRELGYVSASRHRHTLRLYTDQHEAGIALANVARKAAGLKPLEPVPGLDPEHSPLIRQMEKSRAKKLAHDIARESAPQKPLTLEPNH